jgi:anthranilate/para-aminobenzoate synthase component I
VPKLFEIESFATVHHLVSTVTGQLAAGGTPVGLLRAAFPGGSITGAPKLRAMQIIEELEPHRRGVYCGAIGWLGFNGDMDSNIAIRTLVSATTGTALLGRRRHWSPIRRRTRNTRNASTRPACGKIKKEAWPSGLRHRS